MTNLVILLVLAAILILLSYVHKDLINPPVILTMAWMFPFLWLVFTEGIGKGGYDVDILAFYYVIGILVFCAGYYAVNKRIVYDTGRFEVVDRKSMTGLFKLFILAEAVLIAFFFYDAMKFVMGHFQYNIWFTYKWNVSMGYYEDFFFIPYLRTASRIFLCIMFVQFLQKGHDKRDTKWFLLQAVLTALLNLMGQGRGALFSLVIPIGIIYILMRRKYSYDSIKIGMKVMAVLLIIFIVYSGMKSPYKTGEEISVFRNIENYLCGSMVAFLDWAKEPFREWGYGLYTFRFFLAILHALGFPVTVVPMVEPYVVNINGNVGNVYTFYKWYANDFGLLYALAWQFAVGALHGAIARQTLRKRSELWLISYAISFYPLIMQFFMDEYITMLSMWLQTVFWILLFLKTKLFYRELENSEGKRRRIRFKIGSRMTV